MTGKVLATYEGQQEIAEAIRGINLEALTQKAVWVDSVADMRELDAPQGITVATRGYYEPNDGGNGFYYIRAKEVGAVDDGGSVIFLDNDNEAKLITDGTVTPEQFGAYGDGVHDDTNAVTKAIRKGKVINCYKTYYLVDAVDLTYISNKKIIGGTFYAEPIDGTTKYVFSFYACKNIIVKDMVLVSENKYDSVITTAGLTNWNNSKSSNRNAFNVYGCENVLIENIEATNMRTEVHVNGNTVGENHPSKDIIINNYKSIGTVGSVFFVGFTNGYQLKNVLIIPSDKNVAGVHAIYYSGFNTDVVYENVRFYGTQYNNCVLNLYIPVTPSVSPVSNMRMSNCYLRGPYVIGISQYVADFLFENCVFEEMKQLQEDTTETHLSPLQFANYCDGDYHFDNCKFISVSGTDAPIMSFRTSRVNDTRIRFTDCSFNGRRISYTSNNFKSAEFINCQGTFSGRIWSDLSAYNYDLVFNGGKYDYTTGDRAVALTGTGTQNIKFMDTIVNANTAPDMFLNNNANASIKLYNSIVDNQQNATLTSGTGTFLVNNVVYNDTVVNIP